MKTLIQRFLQIVALVMLTASQGFAMNFCTCTGELFSSECPCVESHCGEHDVCQESPDCVVLIEFDSEDYVLSQSTFNVSDESVGNQIPQPSPMAGFFDIGTAAFLNFAHTGVRPGEFSGENCVFAEFVSLRV